VVDEILLWSHYADAHRGIAIGFDWDEGSVPRGRFPNGLKVKYVLDRSELMLPIDFYRFRAHDLLDGSGWPEGYRKLADGSFFSVKQEKAVEIEGLYSLLGQKFEAWKHEQERRFIYDHQIAEDDLPFSGTDSEGWARRVIHFQPENVTEIVFGYRCTDEEIQSRIKGTKYFGAITDSQYKFDGANSAVQNGLIQTAREAIVKDYADVGLTQTDIDEIAKKVARNGLTATGVKQAVYQYAFRKPEASTTPTSTGMARNAIEGGDADAIRIAARAYGYNVSDAEMQAALTGGMYNGFAVTKDSILEKAQKSAKGKYFHLADQIDAGLSLEDIFSGYRNYAADALEIDPNQIDFTKDSKWARAFGTKETGQMSLTDWVKTIKTDPTFGWQYTKQANQQSTDIALTLARAFGKVA
jgi:hypothetical protein